MDMKVIIVGFEGPDLSRIYLGILYQIQSTTAVPSHMNWNPILSL